MENVKIVFQWPMEGKNIGGVAVVCNNYLACVKEFESNDIMIDKFNYELPKTGWTSKVKKKKLRNLIYGFKQYAAIKKHMLENPNDILHFHSSRTWLFRKDMQVVRQLYKNFNNPMFLTIHVGDISTVISNEREKHYFIRLMNKCVKKTFFLSKRMMNQFIDAGLHQDRCAVLYNYSLVEHTKLSNKPHTKILLSLASINRDKGIIELLEASKYLPDNCKLYICGAVIEPAIRKPFEKLLIEVGDKCEYCGLVDYEQKNRLLRDADIFVLPSYREGMPISILEALNHSCAIVTTPVGAIPEVLEDKKNCLFVEPLDASGLAEALNMLLTDDQLLKTMQANNEQLSEKYSKEDHIQQLCSYYKA